jgi:hypothetical protein
MTATRRFLAGVLALSLPLAAIAQAAPAAPPAAPAAAPAPVAEGVKVTPYGFILANGYFNGNSLAVRDYPGQAVAAPQGGSVLFSARQSRFGVRLAAKDDWSGADLSGVIEFDFNGGQLSGTTPNALAPSTAWYNGLMRLRLAAMTASWKTDLGNVSVLAGQEYGLVNTLFAESLAWVASPIFWQAGNLWRRSPQFRFSWANTFDGIGLNAAVAVLSPATADPAVDMGSGNQSRVPNFEARIGANAKFASDFSAAVGVGYHMNKRRVAYGTPNQQDISGDMLGVDLDLGLTRYVQVKGEYYTGKGADDTYNGIAAATYGTAGALKALEGTGYWAQLIGKPIPWAWIVLGIGHAEADKDNANLTTGTPATATRISNDQLVGGLIFNAGKAWRFGVEYAQVTSEYFGATRTDPTVKQDATQIGISSQLKF